MSHDLRHRPAEAVHTGGIRARPAGFTLVEVMVALAITAVALVAGIRATSALTDNAGRQGTLLLAHLCAENRLIALRLARQLPPVGDDTSTCTQGGRAFELAQRVQPTPNPAFRRVEARVSRDGHLVVQLTAIVGRN